MRSTFREWAPVVLLALLPALPLFVGGGLVNTRAGGDSPFLLVRVHQLVEVLRAGRFPARWMPQAAYGLGFPFFNFYGSLPYYCAAILKLGGFGYLSAIQYTQTLGFVLAAVAAYGLSRALHPGQRLGNLVVALAYSCVPFHMVNVYVRGDSLSEFFAFIFFPLILWRLYRVAQHSSPSNITYAAISYAGLILTHNISAVIFSPFVALYILWLATEIKPAGRHIRANILALVIGVLLSTGFWLPALAERGYVYLRDMTTGYFHYSQHFRTLDLIQPGAAFDYSISATQQPFRMGLTQAALTIASCLILLIRWIQTRHIAAQSVYFLAVLTLSTFMVTPLSRPLWDHLPVLPMVQFPWRFLSIQGLASSLLLVHLVASCEHPNSFLPAQRGHSTPPQHSPSCPILAGTILAGLVLFAALAKLRPERLLIREADITTDRLMLYEYFTANVGTTIRTDYLPQWVEPRPYTSEALLRMSASAMPIALEGQLASAACLGADATHQQWRVEAPSAEALLAFQTYYFPGWQATVDSRPSSVGVAPNLGYMSVRVPMGSHVVSLSLQRTRTQLIAELISLATAACLALVLLRFLRPQRVSLAVITLILLVTLIPTALAHPQHVAAAEDEMLDLSMDFDRIPYLHRNPGGVRFANGVLLRGYQLSSQELSAGDVLTARLSWQGHSDVGGLRSRVSLVSPANHLYGVPLVLASSEQDLGNEWTTHALRIPETTAPGVYLITIEIHDQQQTVSAVTPDGHQLGTTYLMPIRVFSDLQVTGAEPVLAQFGQDIALSQVTTDHLDSEVLEVALTWLVSATPAQNFKTALRLRDGTGTDVAQLDVQPGYGFYPTSMWRPGELVHDHYLLRVDEGTPPGPHYSLDVVLYDAASLQPVGTTRVSDVVIVHPTIRTTKPVLRAFDGGLGLSDLRLANGSLSQGETAGLVTAWTAMTDIKREYLYRVVLAGEGGSLVDLGSMPIAADYPCSRWQQGTFVVSRYGQQIPENVAQGTYQVSIVVVDALTGTQLGTSQSPLTIDILDTPHNFTVPEMDVPVGATFGDIVRLLGYDFTRGRDSIDLTLHWQALSAPQEDYKLFVHLYDPVSERIAAQQDVLLGGDDYPTGRWVAQEIVKSETALDTQSLIPDSYQIAVGLYTAEGRLPIVVPAPNAVSADRLLLGPPIQIP